MSDRFVRRLYQFARTVDNVDEATLDGIERTLYDYMKEALGACYYEICVESPPVRDTTDPQRNLTIMWCSIRDRRKSQLRLSDDDGNVFSQKVFCFQNRATLWVTPTVEANTLGECAPDDVTIRCQIEGAPPYRDYDDPGKSKTAAVLPLLSDNRLLGVVAIEFDRVVPYTTEVRDHLATLVEAVAILIDRRRATLQSTSQTREAISDLRADLDFREECGLPEERRELFLSYPERANKKVVARIKDVLGSEKFARRFIVRDWRQGAQAGPITPQIVNQIRASRYGVCYFSEELERGTAEGRPFRDNPNVLFEAGMMHVLRHNSGDSLVGWVPIRESTELTGDIPFNFAAHRIVVVPRNEGDKELNEDAFMERFEAQLDALLDE